MSKVERFIEFVVDELSKETLVCQVTINETNINYEIGDFNNFCEFPYVNNVTLTVHQIKYGKLPLSMLVDDADSVISLKLGVYKKFLKSFQKIILEKYGIEPKNSEVITKKFLGNMCDRYNEMPNKHLYIDKIL
jgi:hypothetical protein